ncbi:MAG: hypothetical protein ABS35_24315 [Kaistia sp. SCN 65-12]|nr:MAG: hypothetical protein ABS35_24315 [Kaistia sp. SCN 65-12]
MLYVLRTSIGTFVSHVTLSELRQNMARYLDGVTADREPLVVTRPAGRGNVVIMAEEEFAAWQETVHLLGSPANAKRLIASAKQAKAGTARERSLLAPGKSTKIP